MGNAATIVTTAAQQAHNDAADNPAGTLLKELERMRPEYAAALPASLGIETFMRDARTAIQMSLLNSSRDEPSLAECVTATVLGALMTCAQLGLRPGVNGEAHIRARWSSKREAHVAAYEAGYQGLIKLAYASGAVTLIYAREAYQEDFLHVEYGNGHRLNHIPADTDDPGTLKAFYAFAKLTGGETLFDYWRHSRMQRHREKYAPDTSWSPWNSEVTFVAMGRKTMIKQLAKELAITGTLFAEAIAADGAVRVDVTREARPEETSVHEPERAEGQEPVPDEATTPDTEERKDNGEDTAPDSGQKPLPEGGDSTPA